MANPIDKIKKIKGKTWTELRARGGQAISARADQIGLSGNLPSDEELKRLIDANFLNPEDVSPEKLLEQFYLEAEYNFFPAFRQKKQTLEYFRGEFGEQSARFFIERAERAIEGKFDLLGYENLDFGANVDWHFEPVSGKHSPLKHWKQFDELDAEETGDKKIVWELNRHQHFFDLGVAFWLTGDERYAATFARHLDGWMRQNPPGTGVNWASSLEVALRAISWIWAFQFFRDSPGFTAPTFQKALKFLFLHARHLEKYLSTYYSPNTHLTGEALGLYYLGTQLPFLERAAHWRALGEEILLAELDRQILPDGVYFEQSTFYARYTADFYTHFLILKTLNADEFKPETQEKIETKLRSMLDFLMALTRPDGTTPLVGDDDGGKILPRGNRRADDFRACLSSGAILFERGDYKFVAGGFAEETLWLLGFQGARSFEQLPPHEPEQKSFAFESGGYFVMRDGWTETDDYLLVDCGALGSLNGGHAHADALAVNVAAGGRTILTDAGTYTYHETGELRDYFRSSEAHNTLTIDEKSSSEPDGKFSWKTKAEARLNSWISQPRFDFFEGVHDGYQRLKNAPATHTRSILFLKNDYWLMRDYVETAGEHDYKLNFQFAEDAEAAVEKAQNGDFCVSENSAEQIGLRLFTFGDNGDWQRRSGWISSVYGKRANAPLLGFASNGRGSQEFFTFLLPTDGNFAQPEVFETAVSGGRAFVIDFRGYKDLFVFADSGQTIRTEIFNTDFHFLWARLGQIDELPEEFVMIDGTNFSLGGREIINQSEPLKFAVARRFGGKLNVQTDERVFSASLPQKKPTARILKNNLE